MQYFTTEAMQYLVDPETHGIFFTPTESGGQGLHLFVCSKYLIESINLEWSEQLIKYNG